MKKIFLIAPILVLALTSCKKCYECQTYILTENFTELNIPDSECGEFESTTEAVNSIFEKYDRQYPNAFDLEVECFEN